MKLKLKAKTTPKAIDTRSTEAARLDAKRKAARDLTLDLSGIDWNRRERCRFDLHAFIESYLTRPYSELFKGPAYPDQLARILRLEKAVLNREQVAHTAMRGGGKTSECRAGILWAAIYGHSHYSVLFGATGDDAGNNLDAIKYEFRTNAALLVDFPEICMPVAAIEGSARRCSTQTIDGEPTFIEWAADQIILPIIPKTYYTPELTAKGFGAGCGAIIGTRALKGAFRGLNVNNKRPQLVLIDDCETEESVKSIQQTGDLRNKIDNAVGGLAAQNESLGILYVGTIQTSTCLTAEFTDPKQQPLWQGVRYRYMSHFPDDEEIWEKYMEIRRDVEFGGVEKSRKLYRDNRAKMDAGAVVSWPEGFDASKYDSAIEKYYAIQVDKKDNGPRYCACELQNDPELIEDAVQQDLLPEDICRRVNNMRRGQIPTEAHHLAAFIDVHGLKKHLYWTVMAFGEDYTAWVVNYGRTPKAKLKTIGDAYPHMSVEAAIRAALDDTEKMLLKMKFIKDDGTEMRVPPTMIDSNWSQTTDVIYAFCREAKTRGLFLPSRGVPLKPGQEFHKATKRAGEVRGDHWRIEGAPTGDKKILRVSYDTNYWKSFVQSRFKTPIGDAGAWSIFGRRPEVHREFAEHLTSEYSQEIETPGKGKHQIWYCLPARENHWLDCVVGCAVTASRLGCKLKQKAAISRRKKRRPRRRARQRS